eukprot:jgi/Psemu1/186270/e_gw1.57.106.1
MLSSKVALGMVGFYNIPGLIATDAGGNALVNAFYCSVMTLTTIGFGDICPGEFSDPMGDIFLLVLPLSGLGFFCGPILSMASSWHVRVPGGVLSLGSITVALGVSLLTVLEGMPLKDAIHLSIITGTYVRAYGNITPSSDMGRFCLALYAIMVCNVAASLLDPMKVYLLSFCYEHQPPPLSHRNDKSRKVPAKEE